MGAKFRYYTFGIVYLTEQTTLTLYLFSPLLKLNTHSSCSTSLFVPPFSHNSHPHINIGIGKLKQQEQFITLNLNHQTSHSPPPSFHSLPILQRYSSSLSQTLSTQPQPHLKSSSLPLISSLARPLQVTIHHKRTQHIHITIIVIIGESYKRMYTSHRVYVATLSQLVGLTEEWEPSTMREGKHMPNVGYTCLSHRIKK